MKKLVIISLLVVVAGCTSKQSVETPKRQTASLENHHPDNLQTLQSMPLFANIEKLSPNEAKTAQTLVEIFTKIQNESHAANEPLNRSTHAKGSCYDGDFTIYSDNELQSAFKYSPSISARLHQGLFNQPGKLDAIVRFANAKGERNADTVGDVRALSFSVDTSGREPSANGDNRQDFMNNSTPLFAVRNIQEFFELMKAARLSQGDLHYIPDPFLLPAVLKAKKLLDTYQRNDTLSYATEEYWSNVPYSYGLKVDQSPNDIVKFKFSPCDGQGIRHEPSTNKAANYLQADLEKRARDGKVCFYMQAQFFDLNAMNAANKTASNRKTQDWVENGGELWDESILPFYTIAKLELSSTQKKSCDDIGFSTRVHSTRSLQPLGSLARVRSFVEENSRARRMGEVSN